MLIWLTRFVTTAGTIWLPRFQPVDTLDTAGYKSAVLPLSRGGSFDPQAGARLPRRLRSISHKGMLIEASASAIQTAYDAVAVGSGMDGLLYGQSETGALSVWITARMLVDPTTRDPKGVYRYRGSWALDIATAFDLYDTTWHGTRHGTALFPLDTGVGLDAGSTLDDVADTTTLATSPQTITVTNDGTMPVDDAVLQVHVGSADLTVLTYQCGRAKATLTGTFKAGNDVIIDAGNALVAHQTLLTSGAAAGATALAVANAAGTGWVADNRVRLVLDDGTVWEGTIASLTGTTTVNLVTGIPGAVSSGRALWAAAYSGFSRDATLHTIDTWLRFAPGANSLVITKTGGSSDSTLTRSFWDQYA